MEEQLLKIFEGNSELFITTSLTGEVDERGKTVGQTLTVHEPVTLKIWKEHLEGTKRIGIKPEKDDMCKWGCIDIDPQSYKDYSQKKVIDILKDNQLPLVPVRSKSGGLHLFLFLDNWYPVKDVLKKLHEWNKNFFQALEVFPMNKCMNMPYFNMNATTEFAYNESNTPVMIGTFIEIIRNKTLSLDQLQNIKVKEYEPEEDWKHYPPCVQKMIMDKWSGNHRNDLLYNVGVLEMKKSDGKITIEEMRTILQKRNQEIFVTPMDPREIDNSVAKSVIKKDYNYKCPPKLGAITPICNKDLCKFRKLGIGSQVPDLIDDFEEIEFIRSTKSIEYSFVFQGEKIVISPEDMKDEKSFRVKLLRYGIYWVTLPRPRSGPSPFEMLISTIVKKAVENEKMKFEDTLGEEKYNFLKKFFESHIEEDDFDKLQDNYVVLDSKTNVCYFKKITFEKFLGNDKTFKSAAEAMHLLGCERIDYHEGVKNVWSVEMPKFVDYKKSDKPKEKKTISEMDEEFHTGKFRT
jgi:hypothetical protein|tara:strand:- start:409 stop:1962 length:1554 start_codon:yes stop_codon:yes gene_type:complete